MQMFLLHLNNVVLIIYEAQYLLALGVFVIRLNDDFVPLFAHNSIFFFQWGTQERLKQNY